MDVERNMSDGEIKLLFKGVEASIVSQAESNKIRFDSQDATLNRIESTIADTNVKVTATNGTVAAVKEQAAFLKGAIWVGGFIMSLVIIPILGWALYSIVNLHDTITQIQNVTK